ncbi:MAG: hypothetical protein WA885_18630 [Phormidesmis sp.]
MDFELFGRMPVSQLSDRYQRSKSVIYTRLKALDIQSEKIGIRAYINDEQLALIDALHKFIQRGGTTAEFIVYKGLKPDGNP